MEKVFITQEELSLIQGMNNDFTKAKITLGDIELQKQDILKGINELKNVFAQHEKKLVDKYGADAIINMQTGEVTKKEK
jgi:lipopolysaccharide biosynthesis regulator YciM